MKNNEEEHQKVAKIFDTEQQRSGSCNYQNLRPNLQKLLTLQLETNQKLLMNSQIACQFLWINKLCPTKAVSLVSSDASTLPSISANLKEISKTDLAEIKCIAKTKKHKKNNEKDSDYLPEQQEICMIEETLKETKNIPKNFGRSIMSFCRVKKSYVLRVLQQCKIEPEKFYQFLQTKNGKITTILNLKSMWIECESGIFARPMRIISQEYLRKHSLAYIYNSRIQRKMRNTKYRIKLLEALQRPFYFTNMKDF